MRTDRFVVGQSGLKRLWRALHYSLQGLRAACRHEPAFREEVLLSVVIIPLALYLGDSGVERALLVGIWLQVLIVELLNSGLEAVVDRVGAEYHALSGIAKDVGSAAVLLALLTAAGVWGLILLG
ncbi:diacylglycerol kinase (ATP) [Methylohalomonas lacus]|uniref:Diacylglycerol kinase n=1 Tax=Methylohalomonas lacus TaxID=398773 RepID=A0AAE3HKG0_9GAMM|nr:diacylglycerol kinase [Methylohalomonas lacus]MCS3902072.1 diacylglycerol kinase (ATP) [Methylohalomonas lacus]